VNHGISASPTVSQCVMVPVPCFLPQHLTSQNKDA